MNVLHINETDIVGGAGIAAYRLHEGLVDAGIDSKLLVENLKTSSSKVGVIERKRLTEELTSRLIESFGLSYINIRSTFNIVEHPFYQNADILNFHNLHGNYFNYLAIPNLTKSKPAIWTLHDMWGFTGHCAYSYNCDRWQTGCGKCPYPNTYPTIKRDATSWEWKLKNWIYDKSNLEIVTPSKWLADQVRNSILNRFSIHHIPYGLDPEAYKPLDKPKCRDMLGISSEKKVLMFGAQNLNDTRKGGDLLVKALKELPKSLASEILLLTLGDSGQKIADLVEIPTLSLGYISSDLLKSIAYSAADLFIFPTRADNLPLVLQESMACGTPLVSFNIGGVSDLVRPNITGYLARPENTKDFTDGIVQLLEDRDLRAKMSVNCREIALKEYSLELQAKRYIELYEKII